MCLTSDAVYRLQDADAIFRIERKDGQKIAKNSKSFYTKYGQFTSNHCGSVRGTLLRIVSKYIFFWRMFQTFYRRFYQNTTNHVMGSRAGLITTNHDMRPIRLISECSYTLFDHLLGRAGHYFSHPLFLILCHVFGQLVYSCLPLCYPSISFSSDLCSVFNNIIVIPKPK